MEKELKSKPAQRQAMPAGNQLPASRQAPTLQLQATGVAQMEDGQKTALIDKTKLLATADVTMGIYVEEKFKDTAFMSKEIGEQVAKIAAGTTVEDAAKALLIQIENAFINDSGSSTLDLLGKKKSDRYRKKDFHKLAYPGNPTNEKKKDVVPGFPMDKARDVKKLISDKSKEKDKAKKAEIQKKIDEIYKDNPDVKTALDDEALANRMNADLETVRPERRANSGSEGVFTQDDLKALDSEGRDLAMKYIKDKLRPITSASGHQLSEAAADSFNKMYTDAKADGITIGLEDSYRSPAAAKAAAKGGSRTAIAEYSSHSLGLAVDVTLNSGKKKYGTETSTSPMNDVVSKHESDVHKWIFVKGGKYGWFPYMNEPWHWEYNPSGYRATFQKEVDDYIAANRKPKAKKK